MGEIHINVDTEKAPITAKNFTDYVEDGFFDGTIFHRVIPNFMIQGGGMTEDMSREATTKAKTLQMKLKMDSKMSNIVLLWQELWPLILQALSFLLTLLITNSWTFLVKMDGGIAFLVRL